MATVSLRLLGMRQGDDGHHHDYLASMSLPPDQPPLPSSPAKSKLTLEERRARQADRLTMTTASVKIGEGLKMLAADDVKRLQTAAARLELSV